MGDGSPMPGMLLWGTPYPPENSNCSPEGELKVHVGLIYPLSSILAGRSMGDCGDK